MKLFLKKAFFLYFGKGIFRTLVYLELEVYSKPEAYSEHSQTYTMARFAKIASQRTFQLQSLKCFHKKPDLRNFFIFREKELSLTFHEVTFRARKNKRKHFLNVFYILGNKTFQPQDQEVFYISVRNLQALKIENFLYCSSNISAKYFYIYMKKKIVKKKIK